MQLRLTRRALEDLHLSIEQYAGRPATDYREVHVFVTAFVERRSQSARGQELTNLPVTAASVYNLHHGRWRALTWHDEDSDVVWLLGVGWHESGSRGDAYTTLKARALAASALAMKLGATPTVPRDDHTHAVEPQPSRPTLTI